MDTHTQVEVDSFNILMKWIDFTFDYISLCVSFNVKLTKMKTKTEGKKNIIHGVMNQIKVDRIVSQLNLRRKKF